MPSQTLRVREKAMAASMAARAREIAAASFLSSWRSTSRTAKKMKGSISSPE